MHEGTKSALFVAAASDTKTEIKGGKKTKGKKNQSQVIKEVSSGNES